MQTRRKTSKGGKSALQIGAEIKALGYVVPGSKVLILRDEAMEQQSEGGIILREESQQHPLKGTILGLGIGIEKDPAKYDLDGIEPLMRCTFTKYEGHVEEILLLDGDTVLVEFMTALDLYLFWVDQGEGQEASEREESDGEFVE